MSVGACKLEDRCGWPAFNLLYFCSPREYQFCFQNTATSGITLLSVNEYVYERKHRVVFASLGRECMSCNVSNEKKMLRLLTSSRKLALSFLIYHIYNICHSVTFSMLSCFRIVRKPKRRFVSSKYLIEFSMGREQKPILLNYSSPYRPQIHQQPATKKTGRKVTPDVHNKQER